MRAQRFGTTVAEVASVAGAALDIIGVVYPTVLYRFNAPDSEFYPELSMPKPLIAGNQGLCGG